jgi:hypothetical protein
MPKSMCGEEYGYGGRWTSGSCESVDECNNVCCSPSNSIMTKTECEQIGGEEVSESLCAGTGTITIEMPMIYHAPAMTALTRRIFAQKL